MILQWSREETVASHCAMYVVQNVGHTTKIIVSTKWQKITQRGGDFKAGSSIEACIPHNSS
jgi:hypothetical protein